ncbi:hypothetical protein OC861_002408 [Tilletia horrida]|nr:hypothetical protein OC845_002226 [Tilletia horrida]KAK0567957.1 hypothetical protein OC861_002408 [Tilletia horrida]
MPLSLNASNVQTFYQQHQEIDVSGSPQVANALAEYINSWSQETDQRESVSQDQESTPRTPKGPGASSSSTQYGHASQSAGAEQPQGTAFNPAGGAHTSGQHGASAHGPGSQFTFPMPAQPPNNRIFVGLLPPATISKGPVASKRTKHRAVRACNRCRQGKQKCNGENPCIKCYTRGHDCVYDERPLKKPGLPVASKNRGPGGSTMISDAGKRKLDQIGPSPSSSRVVKVAKQELETSAEQDKVLPHQQWSAPGPWTGPSQGNSTFTSNYTPWQGLEAERIAGSALPPAPASMVRSATQVSSGFTSCGSVNSIPIARQHPHLVRHPEAKPSLKVVVAHGTNSSVANPGFYSGAFGASSASTSSDQQPARAGLANEWWGQTPRPDPAQSGFGFVAVAQPHQFDSISPLSTPVVDTPTSDYHSVMSAPQTYPTLHAQAPLSHQSQQSHSQVVSHHPYQQQQHHYHAQLYASTATTHGYGPMFATAPPTRCISAPVSMSNSSMFHMPYEPTSVTSSAPSYNAGATSANQSTANGSVQQATAYWQRGPPSALYNMYQHPGPVSTSCDSNTARAGQTTDAPSPLTIAVSSNQSGLPASDWQKRSEGVGSSSQNGGKTDSEAVADDSASPKTEAGVDDDEAEQRDEAKIRGDVSGASEDGGKSTEGGAAEAISQHQVDNGKDGEFDALTDADAPGSPVDTDDPN